MSSVNSFTEELSKKSVNYSEQPYSLHSGGTSHWLVDCKAGLSSARLMAQAGGFMVQLAQHKGFDYDLVFGWGGGGSIAVSLMHIGNAQHKNMQALRGYAHDVDDEHTVEGRLHLSTRSKIIAESKVLLVDDVATTGGSLVQMAEWVENVGGSISGALALVDRSTGLAAAALAKLSIRFSSLLSFDEAKGRLIPSPQ